jgi:hypothetical protein
MQLQIAWRRRPVLFHGAGTRWVGNLEDSDHAAHGLFEEIKDTVAGVSCGCAGVFGGSEAAVKPGFDRIKGNSVPGTSGLPGLRNPAAEGYTVISCRVAQQSTVSYNTIHL